MDYKDIKEKIKTINNLLDSIANELTNNKKNYDIELEETYITKIDDIVERKKYHIEVIINKKLY